MMQEHHGIYDSTVDTPFFVKNTEHPCINQFDATHSFSQTFGLCTDSLPQNARASSPQCNRFGNQNFLRNQCHDQNNKQLFIASSQRLHFQQQEEQEDMSNSLNEETTPNLSKKRMSIIDEQIDLISKRRDLIAAQFVNRTLEIDEDLLDFPFDSQAASAIQTTQKPTKNSTNTKQIKYLKKPVKDGSSTYSQSKRSLSMSNRDLLLKSNSKSMPRPSKLISSQKLDAILNQPIQQPTKQIQQQVKQKKSSTPTSFSQKQNILVDSRQQTTVSAQKQLKKITIFENKIVNVNSNQKENSSSSQLPHFPARSQSSMGLVTHSLTQNRISPQKQQSSRMMMNRSSNESVCGSLYSNIERTSSQHCNSLSASYFQKRHLKRSSESCFEDYKDRQFARTMNKLHEEEENCLSRKLDRFTECIEKSKSEYISQMQRRRDETKDFFNNQLHSNITTGTPQRMCNNNSQQQLQQQQQQSKTDRKNNISISSTITCSAGDTTSIHSPNYSINQQLPNRIQDKRAAMTQSLASNSNSTAAWIEQSASSIPPNASTASGVYQLREHLQLNDISSFEQQPNTQTESNNQSSRSNSNISQKYFLNHNEDSLEQQQQGDQNMRMEDLDVEELLAKIERDFLAKHNIDESEGQIMREKLKRQSCVSMQQKQHEELEFNHVRNTRSVSENKNSSVLQKQSQQESQNQQKEQERVYLPPHFVQLKAEEILDEKIKQAKQELSEKIKYKNLDKLSNILENSKRDLKQIELQYFRFLGQNSFGLFGSELDNHSKFIATEITESPSSAAASANKIALTPSIRGKAANKKEQNISDSTKRVLLDAAMQRKRFENKKAFLTKRINEVNAKQNIDEHPCRMPEESNEIEEQERVVFIRALEFVLRRDESNTIFRRKLERDYLCDSQAFHRHVEQLNSNYELLQSKKDQLINLRKIIANEIETLRMRRMSICASNTSSSSFASSNLSNVNLVSSATTSKMNTYRDMVVSNSGKSIDHSNLTESSMLLVSRIETTTPLIHAISQLIPVTTAVSTQFERCSREFDSNSDQLDIISLRNLQQSLQNMLNRSGNSSGKKQDQSDFSALRTSGNDRYSYGQIGAESEQDENDEDYDQYSKKIQIIKRTISLDDSP